MYKRGFDVFKNNSGKNSIRNIKNDVALKTNYIHSEFFKRIVNTIK